MAHLCKWGPVPSEMPKGEPVTSEMPKGEPVPLEMPKWEPVPSEIPPRLQSSSISLCKPHNWRKMFFLASTISTSACHLNVYSSSYPKTEKGYHHSKVDRNVIIPKATETELPERQSLIRDSSNYSFQRCYQVDVCFHTRCTHQLSPSLSGQWTTHHGNCPLQPPVERKHWEEATFSACPFQRN